MSNTDLGRRLTAVSPLPQSGPRRRLDSFGGVSAADWAPYRERLDPFYDQLLWEDPPSLWHRWTARHIIDQSTGRRVVDRHPNFRDPVKERRAFNSLVGSDHVARIIALLHQFRHADAKQIAAWCQLDPRNLGRYLKPLYEFGIVARGSLNARRVAGGLPYLYALHDGKPLRRYLRALGPDAAVEVLGVDDRRPRFAARHIRHNLTVVDATLRTLETNIVFQAVSGEQGASAGQLLGISGPAKTLAADTVWWREDGLRVAVEVAATPDRQHLASKMARWASLLASQPADAAIVVVWLNAIGADHEKAAGRLRDIYTAAVTGDKVRRLDGTPASPAEIDRVRSRMLLASWVDWYPAPREVSLAGVDLMCAYTPDSSRWVPVSLANPDSYPNPAGHTHTPPAGPLTPTWAQALPFNTPATP